jgi:hypothetical protein
MVLLLPELESLYSKNDQLPTSLSDEIIEGMYSLFSQEVEWQSLRYQYEEGKLPSQIAMNLFHYVYPQQQSA